MKNIIFAAFAILVLLNASCTKCNTGEAKEGSWPSESCVANSTPSSGSQAIEACSSSTVSRSWSGNSSSALSNSLDSSNFDVAISDCKDVVAIFLEQGSSQMKKINYSGGSWSTVATVQLSPTRSAYSPSIEFGQGKFGLATWIESDGSSSNMVAMSYVNGVWSTPQVIGTGDNGLTLAVGQDNKGIAVWHKDHGGTYRIWSSIYDGSIWGAPVEVRATSNQISNLKISYEANKAILIWGEWDGTKNLIWWNNLASGSWGTAATLQASAITTNFFDVDINELGHAVAVWSESEIQTRFFDGTTWSAQSAISMGSTSPNMPSVSINNSDNAIATWQQNSVTTAMYSAFRTAGTWGAPVRIDNDNSNYNEYSKVELAPDNKAVSVWEFSHAAELVIGNSFDGSSWTTPTNLSAGTGLANYVFRMDMNRFGDAFVIWNVNASWMFGNMYQ